MLLLLAQGPDALRRLLQPAITLGEEGRNARIGKAILLGTYQRRVRQREGLRGLRHGATLELAFVRHNLLDVAPETRGQSG